MEVLLRQLLLRGAPALALSCASLPLLVPHSPHREGELGGGFVKRFEHAVLDSSVCEPLATNGHSPPSFQEASSNSQPGSFCSGSKEGDRPQASTTPPGSTPNISSRGWAGDTSSSGSSDHVASVWRRGIPWSWAAPGAARAENVAEGGSPGNATWANGSQQPQGVSNQHTARWRVFTDQGREMFSQGRMREAERYFSRALDEAKLGFGEDDPHVASACNNLAELYRVLGRFQEAEPLYLRASQLLLSEAAKGDAPHPAQAPPPQRTGQPQPSPLGPNLYDDPEAAALAAASPPSQAGLAAGAAFALHNLGGLYLRQGQLEKAERSYRQALEIKETTLGNEHPEYGNTLFHLAEVLRAQGRREESTALLQHSLQILETSEGGDVNKIVRRTLRLAQLLMRSQAWEDAERVLRRALHMAESSLQCGPHSQAVAALVEGIAQCLVHRAAPSPVTKAATSPKDEVGPTGKVSSGGGEGLSGHVEGTVGERRGTGTKDLLDEAQILMQKSLEIKEAALGKRHLAVAMTLLRLADILLMQADLLSANSNKDDDVSSELCQCDAGSPVPPAVPTLGRLEIPSSVSAGSGKDGQQQQLQQGLGQQQEESKGSREAQQLREDAQIAVAKASRIAEAEWERVVRHRRMAAAKVTPDGYGDDARDGSTLGQEGPHPGSRRRLPQDVPPLLCLMRSLELQARVLLSKPGNTEVSRKLWEQVVRLGKEEHRLVAASPEIQSLMSSCETRLMAL